MAGLGFFHGVNPAMGWLFAVALGLNRGSRKTLLLAWAPIALGHAAAIALVLLAVLAVGLALDPEGLRRAAGVLLIGWALWHAVRGHRQRLRFGMQTGVIGLAAWSFLMSSTHGAGLMLVPALMPLCRSGFSVETTMPIALAALAVHSAAMLVAVAVVSFAVYEWVGLAFLRAGWINLDFFWVAALGGCGVLLLFG